MAHFLTIEVDIMMQGKTHFLRDKSFILGDVVVAQLVEWSLPIPEVRGSNPVIGKNLY